MTALELVGVALGSFLLGVGAVREAHRRSRLSGQLYRVEAPAAKGQPELLMMALHGLLRPGLRRLTEGQTWLSFEWHSGPTAQAHIWIPDGQRQFVEDQLQAAYPGVELTEVPSAPPLSPDVHHAASLVRLERSSHLPIRTDLSGEPLTSLQSTLSRPADRRRMSVQVLARPKSSGWQTHARIAAQRLRSGQRSLFDQMVKGIPADAPASHHETDLARAIESKAEQLGWDCVIRVLAEAPDPISARELLRAVAAGLRPFSGANGFRFVRIWRTPAFVDAFQQRRLPLLGRVTLNATELSALFHLPAEASAQVSVVRSPKLPPPATAPDGKLIGLSNYRNGGRPIRLSAGDARHHLQILGPTGTGKTTLLENLARQDVAAGHGVAIIDQKGDLARAFMARFPAHRLGDVVVIGPDDLDSTFGINPLEAADAADAELVAENVLAIFKRIYERYWGMRTDDILKSVLLTLMRLPHPTLCMIPLLLTDATMRARIVGQVDDPIGLGPFWRWYEGLSEAQRSEAIGPVLNKLRDFLVRPRLRRMLCQQRSTLDLQRVIDGGGVLICDLSASRFGEATSSLLGSFLVAKIWQAARRRSMRPEESRRDFYLYIDEFQQFLGVAGPIGEMLAQARSLRLNLTLANQHLGQLPRELREAVASNCRSRIVFQCAQDDAAHLAKEMTPLDSTALQSLGRFEVAARISVGGQVSPAFTARTLPAPPMVGSGAEAAVLAASRARHTRPALEVDREILKQVTADKPAPPALGVGRRERR